MNTLCFLSGLTSSEWAAWVQAGASVAAIVAGVLAIMWQVRRSAAQQRAHDDVVDIRRLQLMWVLAYECRVELQYMSEHQDPYLIDPNLRTKVEALNAIPLFEIPTINAGKAFFAMIDAYSFVSAGVKKVEVADNKKLMLDILQGHVNAAWLSFEFAEKQLRYALSTKNASIPEHTYSINSVPYPPLEVD